MTPEEYQRIKEAEKDHLRKLKKLKEAHRQLERQQKVTKAVTDMTSSISEKMDVHDDMMSRIATESAINEARLEMAIESRESEDLETQSLEDELELAKVKARELIRQLKAEEGAQSTKKKGEDLQKPEKKEVKKTAVKSKSSNASKPKAESKDDLPEKTIGRMKH